VHVWSLTLKENAIDLQKGQRVGLGVKLSCKTLGKALNLIPHTTERRKKARCGIPVIPALGRLRQKHLKLEASLAIYTDPI
jgi:hypothetical protein